MTVTVDDSLRARPMSPCISVCSLDVNGYCAGCLRTRDEIAGWLRLTPAEQWALIDTLARRRTDRDSVKIRPVR
ncbi:MAG: DUF1289 domain-containing protein [Steroidobacteraceae bacterium]